MTDSVKNDFLNSIGGKPTATDILVYFRGCTEPATYTAAILNLLTTDPDTMEICNAETGEVIFSRE